MANMYSNRPQGVPNEGLGRLAELLDAVKQEFDNVSSQYNGFNVCRDDYERKISHQISEVQSIRQTVVELEMSHQKLKQQYNEEIKRLQRELDAARNAQVQPITQGPSSTSSNSHHITHASVPPTLSHGQSNLFGPIMAGQGGQAGQLAPPDASQQSNQFQPSAPGLFQNGQTLQHPSKRIRTEPTDPSPYDGRKGSTGYPGHSPVSQQANTVGPTAAPVKRAKVSQSLSSQNGSSGPALLSNTHPSQQLIQHGGAPPKQPATPTRSGSVPPLSLPVPPKSQTPIGGDLDFDKLSAEHRKEGEDWFAVFNPRFPKVLDVNLEHTLVHESVVCCVRFSADGKCVATGCNRSAQIFDVRTGEKVCELLDSSVDRDGDLYIRSVCFSPDGTLLATGAEDKIIRIWDIQRRQIRNQFLGHEQDIYSLDFSRSGRFIASGSGDRTARLWDLETGHCQFTLSIEDGVTTVAISPDGKWIAAGSLDKIVRVWDAGTGICVEKLEGHKDSVYSVAFSPDGKDLLSGSLDKTIKLWELASPRGITSRPGTCRSTFTGHKDFVLSVAWAADGSWVVSGSKDRGVQFWDHRTGQTQLMLQGHKNSVISVAMSPTGNVFATGSGDARARIWSYENLSPVE